MLHWQTLAETQTISMILCNIQNNSSSPFLSLEYLLSMFWLFLKFGAFFRLTFSVIEMFLLKKDNNDWTLSAERHSVHDRVRALPQFYQYVRFSFCVKKAQNVRRLETSQWCVSLNPKRYERKITGRPSYVVKSKPTWWPDLRWKRSKSVSPLETFFTKSKARCIYVSAEEALEAKLKEM